MNDQTIKITDSLLTKIPVLGQIYAAGQAVENLLGKAFPKVFLSSSAVASKMNNQIYDQVKNEPYFFLLMNSNTFKEPMLIFNGMIPMSGGSLEVYNRMVAAGDVKNGFGTKPGNGGAYIMFPNVIMKIVSDEKAKQDDQERILAQLQANPTQITIAPVTQQIIATNNVPNTDPLSTFTNIVDNLLTSISPTKIVSQIKASPQWGTVAKPENTNFIALGVIGVLAIVLVSTLMSK